MLLEQAVHESTAFFVGICKEAAVLVSKSKAHFSFLLDLWAGSGLIGEDLHEHFLDIAAWDAAKVQLCD